MAKVGIRPQGFSWAFEFKRIEGGKALFDVETPSQDYNEAEVECENVEEYELFKLDAEECTALSNLFAEAAVKITEHRAQEELNPRPTTTRGRPRHA